MSFLESTISVVHEKLSFFNILSLIKSIAFVQGIILLLLTFLSIFNEFCTYHRAFFDDKTSILFQTIRYFCIWSPILYFLLLEAVPFPLLISQVNWFLRLQICCWSNWLALWFLFWELRRSLPVVFSKKSIFCRFLCSCFGIRNTYLF